jgi:Fe-coproporphyrin III synthase
MCDIWKTRGAKTFGVRELLPQLDSIRGLGVKWIVFSGGEPLMNPELPQMCPILRQEGIRLTLLSTGLLLKKHANDVAANFNDVIVSLDGPPAIHDEIRRVEHAFRLLQEGISALRRAQPEMQITARCTVQKANHRYLWETAETAKLLQLNGISFLAVDLASSAFNRPLIWPVSRQSEVGLSLDELPELEDRIEFLIRHADREYGAGFIAESPKKLRRIASHFRAHLGLEAPEAPQCNAPWVSAVIEADGAVRPCFFHRTIGNLQNATLDSVVNGATAQNFRAGLNVAADNICKKCVCSLNYRS